MLRDPGCTLLDELTQSLLSFGEDLACKRESGAWNFSCPLPTLAAMLLLVRPLLLDALGNGDGVLVKLDAPLRSWVMPLI